ncbi:uncharacterized protein LOC110032857 isoform X2 [Phalaenopsis equestris]|nr:uncharacterized protein LOC110032857 isoform X2 [Phalaenopsis equestris]
MSEKAYIRCFNAMQNKIVAKARVDVWEHVIQFGCVRLISFVCAEGIISQLQFICAKKHKLLQSNPGRLNSTSWESSNKKSNQYSLFQCILLKFWLIYSRSKWHHMPYVIELESGDTFCHNGYTYFKDC